MAVTAPKPSYGQYYRVQVESSYGGGGGSDDWPVGGNGGGNVGYRDMPVITGQTPIPAVETPIFATYQAGKRAINQQAPVPGGYEVGPHSLEMPVFLELIHPFLYGVLGSQTITPTAGSAAKASTVFASLADLDTQSDGTEQLKFVVSSSTDATAASIDIVQSGSTVETVNIGTSASSVDGDYYSKGAYDGSSNAITFSTNGTVTSGSVVVSGIDLNTSVFSLGSTIPSFKIEEGGLPRSASNSMFYTGAIFPDITFNYDRTALDGLLMATVNMVSQFPASATAGTWANDAKTYYHPLGSWTASVTKDGVTVEKVQSASITVNGGNLLFPISAGSQDPSGKLQGAAEVTGTVRFVGEDATEWNDYVGQTVQDLHITFTSPNSIVDSTAFSILFEFSELYTEVHTPVHGDGYFVADLNFRTTDDASDGIIKVTTVDRMPV